MSATGVIRPVDASATYQDLSPSFSGERCGDPTVRWVGNDSVIRVASGWPTFSTEPGEPMFGNYRSAGVPDARAQERRDITPEHRKLLVGNLPDLLSSCPSKTEDKPFRTMFA